MNGADPDLLEMARDELDRALRLNWRALAKVAAEATRLDAVLYHLADSLRIIAILLSPIMPRAARALCGKS